LTSPFNNIKDYGLFISILNQISQTKNTNAVSLALMTLDFLNQKHLILNYVSDISWRYKSQIFTYLLQITQNTNLIKQLSPHDQAKLYYYTAAGQFIRDHIAQKDIEPFAVKANQLEPNKPIYQIFAASVNKIFDPSITPEEFESQIIAVKKFYQDHPQYSILNQLLSQLYLSKARSMARFQKNTNFYEEIKALNLAIDHSPLSASIRVYKIRRLIELGKFAAAKAALNRCMAKISPKCTAWAR